MMRKHFKKEVVTHDNVLEKIVCDCCKLDIHETKTDYFFEVTSSHSRGGIARWDTTERYDLCSLKCLTVHMNSFLANPENTDNYEIEVVNKSNVRLHIRELWED